LKIPTTSLRIITLLLVPVMILSCHLEDFNMSKVVRPDDIIPRYTAPLAFGTFKVSDLSPAPLIADIPIPAAGLTLKSVEISKAGTSFSSAAVDSAYLVTLFTNNTLCEVAYALSFINSASGQTFTTFRAVPNIPPMTKDFMVRFDLDKEALNNLKLSTDVALTFTLLPPSSGILTFKEVKDKTFTMKIFFYAPTNLLKL